MENLENVYLLDSFSTHQSRKKWFTEVFPEVHGLGDSLFG
jgi:hypothetical protein